MSASQYRFHVFRHCQTRPRRSPSHIFVIRNFVCTPKNVEPSQLFRRDVLVRLWVCPIAGTTHVDFALFPIRTMLACPSLIAVRRPAKQLKPVNGVDVSITGDVKRDAMINLEVVLGYSNEIYVTSRAIAFDQLRFQSARQRSPTSQHLILDFREIAKAVDRDVSSRGVSSASGFNRNALLPNIPNGSRWVAVPVQRRDFFARDVAMGDDVLDHRSGAFRRNGVKEGQNFRREIAEAHDRPASTSVPTSTLARFLA